MSDPNPDRLPPHSIEAEQGVLGCLLLDPAEAHPVIAARLRGGRAYFYDQRHQAIWAHAHALMEKQQTLDLLTLQQSLKDANVLDEVGGIAALSAMMDAVPSAANLPHYLGILWDKYILRRVIAACASSVARAYDCAGDVPALLNTIEADLTAVTEEQSTLGVERSARDLVRGFVDQLEQNHYTRGSVQLQGLPTLRGQNNLDKILRGIRDTYYLVLAGRPGDGKTSFALNVLEHLALDYVWREPTGKNDAGEPVFREQTGIPIAIFSIEMDGESLISRMVFGRAGVDTAEFSQGFARKEDQAHLVRAAGQFASARVWVDDTPGQTIGQIAAKARRMVKQYGIKLFVLDYLQLVELEDASGMDRVKELTKVSRKIMALKKQLRVPWLVLAQMNRNIETAESKRPPLLSDLKDCGAIEQDADAVMFLHKPELKRLTKEQREAGEVTDEQIIAGATPGWDWSKVPKRVNAFVAKNRFGPVGHAEMVFAPNLCRFEDFHQWKVRMGVEDFKAGETAKALTPRADQPEFQENL